MLLSFHQHVNVEPGEPDVRVMTSGGVARFFCESIADFVLVVPMVTTDMLELHLFPPSDRRLARFSKLFVLFYVAIFAL